MYCPFLNGNLHYTCTGILRPAENKDEFFFGITDRQCGYMLKAGELLKTSLTKMIHVSCLVHAIHRIAKHIRVKFPNIDAIIFSIKKVFLKDPLRIAIFKEKLPNSSLPPKSIY